MVESGSEEADGDNGYESDVDLESTFRDLNWHSNPQSSSSDGQEHAAAHDGNAAVAAERAALLAAECAREARDPMHLVDVDMSSCAHWSTGQRDFLQMNQEANNLERKRPVTMFCGCVGMHSEGAVTKVPPRTLEALVDK